MSRSEANATGWRGTNEGSKLAGNADLWISGNLENSNEFGTSGFNGFPAGFQGYSSGIYANMGGYGYFWFSTEFNSNDGWSRQLDYGISGVYRSGDSKRSGISVRCLKD